MILRPLALCLAAAAPAWADVPCDTASFPATPASSFHAARVRPGPHATFLSGRGSCPNAAPACHESAYVVPGDRLLTAATHGPYICAYYTNGTTEAAGWLPAAQLELQPASVPRQTAWLGTWHYGDSTITTHEAGRDLAVTAQAYWPSKSDLNGHEATLNAKARPQAARLSLADPDDPQGCKLVLTLIVPNLVAHDNNACGGANVTLSGVYHR